MKKNLLDKMISRHKKENGNRQGRWLYATNEVVGYVTADNEFLNLRPTGTTNDK